ncbi:MAG: porin family protein [Cytophagaceae bacterium]
MRNLYIFCLLFCLPFTSMAQGDFWGLKAGLNITKISKVDISNGLKPGFHVGAYGVFHTAIDGLTFQHEVLFSTRGVSLSLPDSIKALNNNSGKYSRSFNYIDLPWMLNYHFSDAFYISAGGQLSIYAHFKKPKFDPVVYNKDNVNTLDACFLLGAGVDLDNNLGFGVRFTGGMVPCFDTGNKGKNYIMQVFMNYAMNKKGGRRR